MLTADSFSESVYGDDVDGMTRLEGTCGLVAASLVEALTSSMTPKVRAMPYEEISCVLRLGWLVLRR